MQKPVVEPPQLDRRLEPGGSGPVSSACLSPDGDGQLRVGPGLVDMEVTMNVCGVVVTRLQGKSWAPIPSNGTR